MLPMRPIKLPVSDFDKIEYPFLVTSKLDGVRAYSRDGKLYGISGKPIGNGYIARIPEALGLPDGLDCEIVCGESLRETVGNTNSKSLQNRATGKDIDVTVYVFDYFREDKQYLTYMLRMLDAHEAMAKVLGNPVRVLPDCGMYHFPRKFGYVQMVSVIPISVGSSVELTQMLNNEMRQGYPRGEGLILKKDTPYCQGRSVDCLKVKPMETLECTVIAIHPHSTKPGWWGSLVCECTEFSETFSVGSGFNDSQRMNPEEFRVGDKIVINYRPFGSFARPNLPVYHSRK